MSLAKLISGKTTESYIVYVYRYKYNSKHNSKTLLDHLYQARNVFTTFSEVGWSLEYKKALLFTKRI